MFQSSLQVFDDICCDDTRFGEIVAVFEAIVFEPENVETDFVTGNEVVVVEAFETVGLFALVAVRRIVALDEVLQVIKLQRICLQREVNVRPEIVDPELLSPS